MENAVADRLSRLVFEESMETLPIHDKFPNEHLFSITNLPWYAHIVNYLATGEIPLEWSARQAKIFI